MAIETTIQLSTNKSLSAAYVRINTPRSFKAIEKFQTGEDKEKNPVFENREVLKLAYDIESYSEPGGLLLNVQHGVTTNYTLGDIWSEAYAHLKTNYQTYKDV